MFRDPCCEGCMVHLPEIGTPVSVSCNPMLYVLGDLILPSC